MWLWIGYWVVLFALTHTPKVPGGRFAFDYADKIVHCGLYFLLTWLGGRYLRARGRLTVSAILAWAGVYLAYGAVDEWLQQFVGRTMSLSDWFADLTGIVLGTLWLLGVVWRVRLSEAEAIQGKGPAPPPAVTRG